MKRSIAFKNKIFFLIKRNYIIHKCKLLIIRKILKNENIILKMTQLQSYAIITQICNI